MLDVSSESTISLIQAARLLPPGRRGRPVSLSCLLRWVLTGATGPSGERVRLEAVRLGGRWVTSREALQRFAERLTPALSDTPTPPTPRTPTARQRACERAAAELERLGI
jgi:hypothetical protein